MKDGATFPQQPFFSCEETAFSVLDKEALRRDLLREGLVPVVTLQVGPNNIFEQPPRQVIEHHEAVVAILCDDGTTVYLDFDRGTAQKRTPEGEFRYMGDLEEGNGGKGFIRVR